MSENFEKEESGYSNISNAVARSEMSLKAKGMYLILASLPNDWVFSVIGLSKISWTGKEGVTNAIKELEDKGFLTREQKKDGTGKFSGYKYILRCNPYTEKPLTEKPSTEKPPQYIKDIYNTKKTIKEECISPRDNISLSPLENDFERFWNSYPRKVGKPYARQVFMKKVKHNDMPSLLEGLERYKSSKQWKDSQYIPNPSTFINQERWKDEVKSSKKTWNEMNDFEKEMFLDLAKEITEDDLK